jgi:hypothetical protein
MKYWFAAVLAAGLLAPVVEAQAQKAKSGTSAARSARGGYSYAPSDTINTYGDSRTKYGSTNSYRDPMTDRQTRFGPFDHGFFFDSGIEPRGGNSPYQN